MSWFLLDAMSPIRFRLPQIFVRPQRHHLNCCKIMMGQNFFDDAYATIIKNGNKNGERTFRCEENWAVGVAVVTCLQKVVLVIIEEKKGRTLIDLTTDS